MTTMQWSDEAASIMENIWPTGRGFPTAAYKQVVYVAESIASDEKATLVCRGHVCKAIKRELEQE